MNITRRLAVNAAIIIVGTGLAFSLAQVVVLDRVTRTAAERELASLDRQFQLQVERLVENAVTGAQIYAHSPPVVAAFARGDREALAALTRSGYAVLSDEHGAKQMQFHRPPATSFFRAHRPEKFGDDLAGFRQTVVDANEERRAVGGLERGRAGVGVRGVVPVRHEGEHVGSVEIGLGLDQAFLESFAERNGIDAAIYLFAESISFDGAEGRYLASTFAGERWKQPAGVLRGVNDGAAVLGRRDLAGERVAEYLAPVRDFQGEVIGALQVAMPVSVYTGLRNQAIAFALVVGAIVLAAGIGVTVWRNRDIGRQIETLVRDVETAKSDTEARNAELVRHCDGFDGTVRESLGKVDELAGALDTTANRLGEVASVSKEQSTTMASAAEEANVCTSGVAEAMTKMAAMIRESVERNGETRALTSAASGAASDCRERVSGMTEAVGRIGEAVSLIESIADQTNLLALNATIEAARAGDAGRGFAVVAGEVKALAGQTARTTDEITAHIQAIHSATGGVAEAIERMADTITRVDEAAGAINEQMDAELSESREVSARMTEAATGVAEITRGIEQASAMASDTADGAARINAVASDVSREGRELRRRIEDFLKAVRAA